MNADSAVHARAVKADRAVDPDSAAGPLTAVVTGGSRGIGLAVARLCVERGWRVVLLARDPARGEAARAAVAGAAAGEAKVALVVGDLSSIRTVRAAGQALLAECRRIDVLVHNAGIWPARRVLTEDGLEQAFAVNHLAPFLLNHLLGPRLVVSGARVIQVSTGLYGAGRVDLERTPTGADFHPMRTYATTKLCNLMLVPLFAAHWAATGVTINAVHPGVIRTGLGDRGGPLGLLLKAVKLTWKQPRVGAEAVVRLAEADGTGRYYNVLRPEPLHAPATDRLLACRVWAQAAALTGLPGTPDAA
jgi:NAD(P)-dependent dehydrogenase (short-subunit alcohol dehydrogenase family)